MNREKPRPVTLNWRGHLAVWTLAVTTIFALLVLDWRPAVIGLIITLALAATGSTRSSPQPPEKSS
jgi:hypothetical protein